METEHPEMDYYRRKEEIARKVHEALAPKVPCLICGKEIPLLFEEQNSAKVCEECKDAVFFAKKLQKKPEESEVQEQGCEYCAGTSKLYQHTIHTNLYINTFGKARTLVVECYPCPPYADCSHKGTPARSAFLIKFCPECGRRLEES